jgi:hypothetical protein
MLPHRRKTYLSPVEEGKFGVLDEYLDDHYESYVSVVVEMYKELKKKFGGPPEITFVIRLIERTLMDDDRVIFEYLDKHAFPVRDVNARNAQLKLFARVIVSEALPIIYKEYM